MSSNNTGLTYFVLCLAAVATLLGIGGLWSASSADGHAKAVDVRVDKAVVAHQMLAKMVNEERDLVYAELAREATAIAVLNGAVAKLQTKAEQSVVEALAKELRDGKSDKWVVQDLASQLLKKADAKTVRLLSRRMGKLDGRVVKMENVLFPKVDDKVMDPPAPSSSNELKPVDPIDLDLQPTSAKSPAPPAK